jgi:hypothetical protein
MDQDSILLKSGNPNEQHNMANAGATNVGMMVSNHGTAPVASVNMVLSGPLQ